MSQILDKISFNTRGGEYILRSTETLPVSYSDLVSKRNNGELVPGMWYRITDYRTTTTQENTSSAGHPFEILVQALTENTLSEDAKAYVKKLELLPIDSLELYYNGKYIGTEENTYKMGSGYFSYNWGPGGNIDLSVANNYVVDDSGLCIVDKKEVFKFYFRPEQEYIYFHNCDYATSNTYFNNSNLSAWELKYCLDNDTDRFAWADPDGYGVIYYLKDEFGNEANFDFKNLQKNGKYLFDVDGEDGSLTGPVNIINGVCAHAEGFGTIASGVASHAEGAKYESNRSTESAGLASHAEGASTYAKADGSHTEGILNTAGRFLDEISAAAQELGISGTPEELAAKLLGYGAHAEGMNNEALGSCSHAEGHATKALSNSTHAEGDATIAFGEASHSEGYNTQAKGNQSHAEGSSTIATGNSSHAEGVSTVATGSFSHAEGSHTEATGRDSHAEGAYNKAIGIASHAEGDNNIAPNEAQHVSGKYATIDNTGTAIFQVGIGNDPEDRKDALRIKTDGDIIIQQDNQEIVLQDKLDSLQKQIDGEINTWFYPSSPYNDNTGLDETNKPPLSEWLNTEDYTISASRTYTLKEGHTNHLIDHLGDVYVDSSNHTDLPTSMWESGDVSIDESSIGNEYIPCKVQSTQKLRLKELLPVSIGAVFTVPTPWNITLVYFDSNGKFNGQSKTYSIAQSAVVEDLGAYCSIVIKHPVSNNSMPEGLALNPTAGQAWRWCDITSSTDHASVVNAITVKYTKDGSSITKRLHWHKIADSDAVKALQEAAKAQLTADTAMNSKLSLSGGQMTGPISFPTAEDGDQVMLKDGDSGIDLLTYTLSGMQAGMSLYPRSSSVNLGRISNYWNNGYVNTLYSYQINAEDSLSITAINNLVLSSENQSLIINASDVTSYTNIYAPAFYETSDIRKKDIKSDIPLSKCYELIDKCQTIIYSLKDQTQEQIGMIAQEIEEFFPEVVTTDRDGFKSLAYDRLVVICFKVLKDVIKRLEKLENAE